MIYPHKFTTLLLLLFISCPFCIGDDSPPAAAPPPADDSEMKCGSCPCKSPCGSNGGGSSGGGGGQELPIPSPPPPSPPPPSLTYLSSGNCDQSPPPPAPRFIYVTGGEPGNGPYQTQPYNWGNYNSSAPTTQVGLLALAASLVALVVCVASS